MKLSLLLAALSVVVVGGDLANGWVAALLLISGVALFAVSVWEPERVRHGLSAPVMVLGLMSALGLLSLIWTEAPFDDALATALIPAAYGATALAVAAVAAGGRSKLVSTWLVAVATIASITGLIGVIGHSSDWAAQIGGNWRAAGLAGYPPALAFLVVAALPSLLGAVGSGRRASRAVALVAAVVCAVALVLTGNRLGIGCAAIILVASFWVRPAAGKKRPGRPDGRAVLLLAVALAGVLLLAGLTERPSDANQGDSGADHGRIDLWGDSMPAISDAPVVGHGSSSYFTATAADQDDPTLYAHNLIVESTVELGVPGGLLAILLFATVGTAIYRLRHRREAWLFGPGLIAFLAFGLVDWQWHLVGVGAVWAVMLGSLASNMAADLPSDKSSV